MKCLNYTDKFGLFGPSELFAISKEISGPVIEAWVTILDLL